ncbi:MAG: holin [Corynebacterium sp.]|jgi:hypothetical protein|nr:holin [Corynebacterium sp.]
MAINLNLHTPGWVWAEHTGEESVRAFAYVLFGAMMTAQVHDMGGVDWPNALSQAGFACLAAVFGSIASLRVANGTASFLPRVVARDRKS